MTPPITFMCFPIKRALLVLHFHAIIAIIHGYIVKIIIFLSVTCYGPS